MTGTYSPFFLAALFLSTPGPSSSDYCGDAPCALAYFAILAFGFVAILVGVWLLACSLMLLRRSSQPKTWGTLLAISYGITFFWLFLIPLEAFANPQNDTVLRLLVLPALAGPILGVTGAVWSLFWRWP
jgi:hypothetical protein